MTKDLLTMVTIATYKLGALGLSFGSSIPHRKLCDLEWRCPVEVLPSLVFASLILLGLIPASIARQKGHAVVPWWIYGSLLFVIALPHAVLLRGVTEKGESPQRGKKQCPYCTEWLSEEDNVCPFCRLRLYDPVLDGPKHRPQYTQVR